MAIKDVTMPALGMSQTTGTIIEWRKKIGDFIEKDDIIFLVETDKSVMDVPASERGVLVSIQGAVGVPIAVGTVIARIETDSTQAKKAIVDFSKDGVVDQETATTVSTPQSTNDEGTHPSVEATSLKSTQNNMREKVLASPKSKKLAESYGIQIEDLTRHSQLVQPYNSDDVHSFISWKETSGVGNAHIIHIVAEVSLESFFHILEKGNSEYEEWKKVYLIVKIVSFLICNNETLKKYFKNPLVNLDIIEMIDGCYRNYFLADCEKTVYSYGVPDFVEGHQNAGVCVEYFEHEHIVDYHVLSQADLFIRLIAHPQKKYGRVSISIHEDLLGKEDLVRTVNTLCTLIENPWLLLT